MKLNASPSLLLVTLMTSLGAIPLRAAATPDAYMGDWQGTLTLATGTQPVAVNLIPYGGGTYETRIQSAFNQRVPVLFHLRSTVHNGDYRSVDAIPFDASQVIRATDDGVVLGASLWAGRVDGDTLTGTVAGKDKGTFTLKRTVRTSPTLGQKPPADAVVLFDGRNFDAWKPLDPNLAAVKWKLVEDGAAQVNGGDIITREKFGAQQLHVEFRLPYMPEARGQGRANSGVYLVGRYEVQVLDSYGLEGEDNECGGIYQIARPKANLCLPPLQWQTYDITFHPAVADAVGKKTQNARITVVHNGVVIHDNLELPRITGGAVDDREWQPEGLKLQDHGNPVQFRNIWVRKL